MLQIVNPQRLNCCQRNPGKKAPATRKMKHSENVMVVCYKDSEQDGMYRLTVFLIMSTVLMSPAFNLLLKMPDGFSLETYSPKYEDTTTYYVFVKSTLYASKSSIAAISTFFLSMFCTLLEILLILAFGLTSPFT